MKDRRVHFRKGLNTLYIPVYDSLCELLGEHWQPFYGLRTLEEQQKLFDSGNKVTNAKAGYSPHNYGCATDWCLWDEKKQPIWDLKDKRWNEYIKAIEKSGARWGGEWGDAVHNELKLTISWKKIGVLFTTEGFQSAKNAVKDYLT